MLTLASRSLYVLPTLSPSHGEDLERPNDCVVGLVLVEDNPTDVAMLRWVLEERGIKCEMKVISHGDLAMAYAQSETHDVPPAVVLLDINLPGFDGLQILKAIRENPLFANTCVGMYTSSTSPIDRVYALGIGADFYIEKPVTLDGLDRVAGQVASVLERGVEPESTS